MGRLPLCLTMAWLALSPGRAAADPDPWFGKDKMLHFSVSAALAAGGYAAGTALWEDRTPAFIAGAGFALGAGVGKELLDLAGYGHPSWRDLAWDVAGTGAGLLLAWGVDALVRPSRQPSPGGASLALTGGKRLSFSMRW